MHILCLRDLFWALLQTKLAAPDKSGGAPTSGLFGASRVPRLQPLWEIGVRRLVSGPLSLTFLTSGAFLLSFPAWLFLLAAFLVVWHLENWNVTSTPFIDTLFIKMTPEVFPCCRHSGLRGPKALYWLQTTGNISHAHLGAVLTWPQEHTADKLLLSCHVSPFQTVCFSSLSPHLMVIASFLFGSCTPSVTSFFFHSLI